MNTYNNYRISQTHPNRGYITILYPITGHVCYGPFQFYVNDQIMPGVASTQKKQYECEDVVAETIEDLAYKLNLRKGDREGI